MIGDFGLAGQPESDVATLVKSWNPDFILTLGDNNYEYGEASTIDQNVGQYYHEFISPYIGSFGVGSSTNRFFPVLGNHDWQATGAQPYLDYFELPGNERYYDFVRGPVHFFAIDSDVSEPDGQTSTAPQALWLRDGLANSTSPWKIVYFHHPPYSSGTRHGNNATMQWPFHAWGASIVIAGHEHTYERIERDSIIYLVNGLGGKSIYSFGSPVTGSVVRYNADYGALQGVASVESLSIKFITRSGITVDSFALGRNIAHVQADRPNVYVDFRLQQNYPNPFNPSTKLTFTIARSHFVVLKVFNIFGEVITSLIEGALPPGTYTADWNGSNVASGEYIARLTVDGVMMARRMTLVR